MYPEYQLPYATALAELQRELAENPRIGRLILAVANHDELELYRSTKTMAEHERLVHATAGAATIRAFADKIVGVGPDTARTSSAVTTRGTRR